MIDKEKDLRMLNSAIDTALGANCELVKLPVTVAIEIRELLKSQKPVKPITQDAWPNPVKVCGSCGGYITYTAGRPRFCPNCGSEMKWDG